MKKILVLTILALLSLHVFSQVCNSVIVKTDPQEPTALDEITLTVEFTCPEYDAWGEEDIYLWVWSENQVNPVGLPDMFPEDSDVPTTNGTGNEPWKSSNPYLKMEKIGDKKYSWVFTPTVLFKLSPSDLRSMGFLLKPKDGGGYGDPDRKTGDLEIKFKSLVFLEELGRTFPVTISMFDVVTIYYNQQLAIDPALVNYQGDLWLSVTAYVNNIPVGTERSFKANKQARGSFSEYYISILPNEHLDLSLLTEGQEVDELGYYFHNEIKTLKTEDFYKVVFDLK